MSRTTMIIIITVAIAIFYLTYDAVRRSREKKLPYVFKRKYHQLEGWLNVTALGLTIDALIIPWDMAWTGTWNTILFGGTALLSANFLYAYEMEYLVFTQTVLLNTILEKEKLLQHILIVLINIVILLGVKISVEVKIFRFLLFSTSEPETIKQQPSFP